MSKVNLPLTGSPTAMRSLAYHYIPVVINDPLPGRSVSSQPDVDAIGCTSARQFLWPNLVQSPQYFRRHNIFHFPFQPCGVAFPMEWMSVATYLLNAESINACRC